MHPTVLFITFLWNTHLLKVLLLFLGVGVIEAHDELALEGDLVVLVEQGGLGMADVQVPGDG